MDALCLGLSGEPKWRLKGEEKVHVDVDLPQIGVGPKKTGAAVWRQELLPKALIRVLELLRLVKRLIFATLVEYGSFGL